MDRNYTNHFTNTANPKANHTAYPEDPACRSACEQDIHLAARCRSRVLITAPPDRAVAVARAIGAGARRTGGEAAVEVCDTAFCDAVSQLPADTGTAILLLREVHAMSRSDQLALRRVLVERASHYQTRIFASSSVSLYDRVREGTFDDGLFYYLNTIHIVMPEVRSCGATSES